MTDDKHVSLLKPLERCFCNPLWIWLREKAVLWFSVVTCRGEWELSLGNTNTQCVVFPQKTKVHLEWVVKLKTGWPDEQSFKCTCGFNDLIDLSGPF